MWWNEPFASGVLGGACFAVVALIQGLRVAATADRPRYARMVFGVALAAIPQMALGGMVAWKFSGEAGDFVAGLTATGFLLQLIGAGDRTVKP